jgi:membrane protein implicated in regulation of membrane protease activity
VLSRRNGNAVFMIILGLVLLIIGIIVGSGILYTIGIILLLVGLILMLVGRTGTMVAGRRHYW